MKKKIILALTACLFAAGTIIHYNLAENTSRMDVSLADISVMAQADGEHDPCPGGPYPGCKFHEEFPEGCEWTMECYVTCPPSACD